MANIVEKKEWSMIPQLENGEVFDGGDYGNANKQTKALANRTAYLKDVIETSGLPKVVFDCVHKVWPDIAPLQSVSFDLSPLSQVFLRQSILIMSLVIENTGGLYKIELLETLTSGESKIVYATANLDYPLTERIPFAIERQRPDSVLKAKIYNQSSVAALSNAAIRIIVLGV